MADVQEFVWQRYPEAEAYLAERVEEFVAAMPRVQAFSAALLAQTGTRLFDWLDHLVLADGDSVRRQLGELDFEQESVPAAPDSIVLHHPGAIFPRILLRQSAHGQPGAVEAAAIQVEQIAAFLMANHLSARIEGTALSPFRRATLWRENGTASSSKEMKVLS